MKETHKKNLEDIGTCRVDVLVIRESGLNGPLSRIWRRRPMSTADIISMLHQPGYKILLSATWFHHQQARMSIYYKDTLRIKDIRVPLNLNYLPLLSMEVSKGRKRSTLLSCFYREHMGGVSGMNSLNCQKTILQRILSCWSTLSTRNKDLLFMGDINLDFQK